MPVDTQRLLTDGIAIDQLLARYTAVVDGREWQQWPDLFAEECAYAVYSLDNVDQGLPLAYVLDDCRARIHDRVKFVTEVWASTVEPYRTRHVVQRTWLDAVDETTYHVRSNFVVAFTEVDRAPGVLTSGYYDDRITVASGEPLIADRRVYLDGTPARYLVYPL